MSRIMTWGRSAAAFSSPSAPVLADSTANPRARSTLESDFRIMIAAITIRTKSLIRTSLFGAARRLGRNRERDAQGGSAARVVLGGDHAADLAHDLHRDRQPQSGAHRAGGEERVEDLLHQLL